MLTDAEFIEVAPHTVSAEVATFMSLAGAGRGQVVRDVNDEGVARFDMQRRRFRSVGGGEAIKRQAVRIGAGVVK